MESNIKSLRDAITKLGKGEMDKIIDFCSELQFTRHKVYGNDAKPVDVIALYKQLEKLNACAKNPTSSSDMSELYTTILKYHQEFADMEDRLRPDSSDVSERIELKRTSPTQTEKEKSVFTLIPSDGKGREKEDEDMAKLFMQDLLAQDQKGRLMFACKTCGGGHNDADCPNKPSSRGPWRCGECDATTCVCGPDVVRYDLACGDCGDYVHSGDCKPHKSMPTYAICNCIKPCGCTPKLVKPKQGPGYVVVCDNCGTDPCSCSKQLKCWDLSLIHI